MVGNLSNFTRIDILRCLLKIEKPVSRSELSKTLDLGEGTIRAILDILKKHNILESTKQGHNLNEKGRSIIKKINDNMDIKKIESMKDFPDKKIIALLIKNPEKIEKPYILRDEAVKNGADGALILKYDKKLMIYGLDYAQDFSNIEKKFGLTKNDILIVAYADSYKLAENGALAAAIELNSDLRNLMQKFK